MKYSGLHLLLALAVSIWGSGVLLAPDALCDPKGVKGPEGSGQPGRKKGKQETTSKRYLRMEEIEIHGDVEKPKTMFVIPRASLRYSRKDREKDFTDEILDPRTKQWIEDTQRWRASVPPP
jgi:hypothetical protein